MRVFAEFQQIVLPIILNRLMKHRRLLMKEVMLFTKGTGATNNKDAQYTNFVNIFLKDTEENIFVKYFDYRTVYIHMIVLHSLRKPLPVVATQKFVLHWIL